MNRHHGALRSGFLKKAVAGLASGGLLACYGLIFSGFFPIASGGLGHDFVLGLPQLLAGYFWFRNNGLSSVLWFSPFICGGVPAFPHPIHFFYSVPQFLSFVIDPFSAVMLNLLIFAAAGFWGHYLLARRLFAAHASTSFFCAAVFLFNGFYAYRYVIGHFLFHSFMLIPWCVLLLSDPRLDEGRDRLRRNLAAGTAVALLLSYMVYSTLQNLMPAVLLSIAAAGLICGLGLGRRFSVRAWAARFAFAGVLALGISAAKLSAVYHFLRHVPRTGYALPQFTGLADLLIVLVQSLFFSPAWERARQSMINMQFALKQHEFEFGLTPVPLVILCVGGISLVWSLRAGERKDFAWMRGRKNLTILAVIFLMLCLPVILNYHTPAWNRFLKTLPIIGSSTQCTRWFCMYIPVITILTAIIAGNVSWLKKYHKTVAVTGVAGVLLLNLIADKSYYRQETYSPLPIMAMYYNVKRGLWEPVITDIGVCTDETGRPGLPIFRNDSLIFGQSQMLCYDSAFGYRLENLPVRQLSPGSVFKETDGFLNIKNPACYVFPEENGCRPGDHFTVAQKDQVVAFTRYRPYDFKMPPAQKIANRLTLASLFMAVLLLVWGGLGRRPACRRQKTGSTAENPTSC
ncbi:MAG: hypothetical protein AB1724_01935 [Thermodesulfobacteriota bacterium]